MKKILLLTAWLISYQCQHTNAQSPSSNIRLRGNVKPFYLTYSLDGAFSSALITNNGANGNGILRFSAINAGINFNFNFGGHLGLYTGVDLTNTGFVEVRNAVSTKYRTYNVGVPLAIKIGNMDMNKAYFFFGGGLDVPFNYREKTFYIRDQKQKTDEWFSSRTPALMPYLMAGLKVNKWLSFKAQYYPGNFLNPDYKDKTGTLVYAGYDVHLVMLSVGYTITRKKDRVSLESNNISE